ncbi:MAG: hypothetical protein ACOCQB_02575 [Halanaerobiaceae bacterium]
MKVHNLLVWILFCLLLTVILSPVVIGEEYAELREGGEFKLYLGSTPLSKTNDTIKGGSKVQIKDKRQFELPADSNKNGYWVNIKFSEDQLISYNSWLLEEMDCQAWIPDWYVSPEDGKPVEEISKDREPFVLNQDHPAYLYPDGPEVGGTVDIDSFDTYEKGKLLRPRYRWENWYLVDIIVYEVPSVLEAWFPREVLSSVDEVEPIEGYLPEGTVIFGKFEDIQKNDWKKNRNTRAVNIIRERDGFVRVSAAAGWHAWTKKHYLVYDKDELE